MHSPMSRAENPRLTPLRISRIPSRTYFERGGGAILTFGVFDGMHRGQIAMADAVARRASALNAHSVVIVFRPRPVDTLGLRPEQPYFTALDETIHLLKSRGISKVGVLKFDKKLAEAPASTFLTRMHQRLPFQELWLGENASIGRGPEGSHAAVRDFGTQLGFDLHVFKAASASASSPERALSGTFDSRDMREASELLGRSYGLPAYLLPAIDRSESPRRYPARTPRLLRVPPDGEYAVKVVFSRVNSSPVSSKTQASQPSVLIIRTARGTAAQPSLLLLDDSGKDLSDNLVRLEFLQPLERSPAELMRSARLC